MEWWSEWWVWAVAALILAVGEVLLPSQILLGFAIGAGVVSLLLLIAGGLLGGSVPALALIFAVVSLISWLVLRRVLGVYRGQVKTFDHDIND